MAKLGVLAAVLICMGPGLVAAPARADSPAHGRIVYATFNPNDESVTGIDLVHADGSGPVTLAGFGYDPRWSPTGNQIAIAGCAAAEQSCVTTVVSPTGSVVRTLPMPTSLPSATAFGPNVWSPNGRVLASGVDSDAADLNGIYTVRSSDGGGLRRVTSNPGGEDIPGSFSPDGRSIVFVRSVPNSDGELVAQGLYTVRTDGTALRRLTPAGMQVNPEHGGRWSPDGQAVVFDARPGDGARFTLWIIGADGRQLHRLAIPLPCGQDAAAPGSFGCFAPSWSPDGRDIAFGTFDSATGARQIYTISTSGTDLRQVTTGDAATDVPDWSR